MQQSQLDQVLQNMRQELEGLAFHLMKTRQLATAQQAESFLRAEGRQPRMPIEFTSQYGEDMAAWVLFGRQTSGFFVEAGAFDGYRYSVTYPFEAIGWNGLLVEGNPERASQCAKRRPNSRVVNAVLSPEGAMGDAKFHVVEDLYGGMQSYSRETPEHLKRIGNTPRREIRVPRASLNQLLAQHQGEIDLVVLDVEGAEVDALEGFDLKRFRPRLLIIEDYAENGSPQLINHMLRYPEYKRAGRLTLSEVFIRADQSAIFNELRWFMQT